MSNEREIKTLDELMNAIMELHERFKHGQSSIEHLWYRGQANSAWGLFPSIQRHDLSLERERNLANDFRMKASRIMDNPPDRKNYSAWVSLMQHYGLPTRMLDWSRSPLIAAFFAVEKYREHKGTDACIWVLRPGALNMMERGESCLYASDSGTAQRMLQTAFIPHEANDITKLSSILACCSVENDLRMYSQQSCFTIHNTRQHRLDADEFKDIVFKLIIPERVRATFLYDLAVFGITEGFVYPDLEHISADLRRDYGIV